MKEEKKSRNKALEQVEKSSGKPGMPKATWKALDRRLPSDVVVTIDGPARAGKNVTGELLAVAMGADALGFIFAAGSPRLMRPEHVRDITKRLPPGVVTVGVFRNERPERVVETVQRCAGRLRLRQS